MPTICRPVHSVNFGQMTFKDLASLHANPRQGIGIALCYSSHCSGNSQLTPIMRKMEFRSSAEVSNCCARCRQGLLTHRRCRRVHPSCALFCPSDLPHRVLQQQFLPASAPQTFQTLLKATILTKETGFAMRGGDNERDWWEGSRGNGRGFERPPPGSRPRRIATTTQVGKAETEIGFPPMAMCLKVQAG